MEIQKYTIIAPIKLFFAGFQGMWLFDPEPTQSAEWHALVEEAMQRSGLVIDDDLKSYLILTLDHFTTKNKIASTVLAIDFLKAVELTGRESGYQIREVGDECLLLSGLFPERALQKNVSLNYFIGLGQHAYHLLGHQVLPNQWDPELFLELSQHFVGLMDVLHAMRVTPKLQ